MLMECLLIEEDREVGCRDWMDLQHGVWGKWTNGWKHRTGALLHLPNPSTARRTSAVPFAADATQMVSLECSPLSKISPSECFHRRDGGTSTRDSWWRCIGWTAWHRMELQTHLYNAAQTYPPPTSSAFGPPGSRWREAGSFLRQSISLEFCWRTRGEPSSPGDLRRQSELIWD